MHDHVSTVQIPQSARLACSSILSTYLVQFVHTRGGAYRFLVCVLLVIDDGLAFGMVWG